MTFLCGEFRHQLDEKGRVRVPARIKSFLDDNSVITRGLNGCLYIYNSKSFEELVSKFQMIPLHDQEAQEAFSRFFAGVYNIEEDGQGRMMIPQPLRTTLKKNIVFVGSFNKIELWDEETFDKRPKSAGLESLMGVLENYGL